MPRLKFTKDGQVFETPMNTLEPENASQIRASSQDQRAKMRTIQKQAKRAQKQARKAAAKASEAGQRQALKARSKVALLQLSQIMRGIRAAQATPKKPRESAWSVPEKATWADSWSVPYDSPWMDPVAAQEMRKLVKRAENARGPAKWAAQKALQNKLESMAEESMRKKLPSAKAFVAREFRALAVANLKKLRRKYENDEQAVEAIDRALLVVRK